MQRRLSLTQNKAEQILFKQPLRNLSLDMILCTDHEKLSQTKLYIEDLWSKLDCC
jgi:hypothetical protein